MILKNYLRLVQDIGSTACQFMCQVVSLDLFSYVSPGADDMAPKENEGDEI